MLGIPQLHAEISRLQNSIFHLERSIEALKEFKDEEDCKLAIDENVVTIQRQRERVLMIEEEIAIRGSSGHGVGPGDVDMEEQQGINTTADVATFPDGNETVVDQSANSIGQRAGDSIEQAEETGETREEGVHL
jgi:hypothetical protein